MEKLSELFLLLLEAKKQEFFKQFLAQLLLQQVLYMATLRRIGQMLRMVYKLAAQ